MIWKYTREQIIALFALIQEREIEEINRKYLMIRAAVSQSPPDKFMVPRGKKGGLSSKSSIGMASDAEIKNFNPGLKVIKQ